MRGQAAAVLFLDWLGARPNASTLRASNRLALAGA